MVRIGVLSVQGDFPEHVEALRRYPSVEAVDVRNARDLKDCDALILPGGESTAHGILIVGFLKELREFVRTHPVWGTCAGLILLSEQTSDTSGNVLSQPLIGGLKITTCRNYFGRQDLSAVRVLEMPGGKRSQAAFIRSPAISSVQDGVTVLASVEHKGERVAVACEQGHLLGTAFHPELEKGDFYWHDLFLNKVFKFKHLKPMPQRSVFPSELREPSFATWHVKTAFPRMLQGGVIMDVVNGAQAKIAEAAGACSVMALERIPADIKQFGGIARMSDPALIQDVMSSVTIPVMAKARIGHFGEARILEALGVDCIDESEVLTPADEKYHIHKHPFKIPFVCGAKDLGEALRRIAEGAAMIRLKGHAGTGNVLEAVRHARLVFGEIRRLQGLRPDEVFDYAKSIQAPVALVEETRRLGRLPVVTFAAGGIATPADVVLMMELGCDGVFVGSGIFKGDNPAQRAAAIVQACTHFRDASLVARVSTGLGKAMVGILHQGETYALTHQDSKL